MGQWGGSESSVPLPTPPRDRDPPGLGLVVPETPSNETNLVKFGERSRTSPCRPRLGVQFHSRPRGLVLPELLAFSSEPRLCFLAEPPNAFHALIACYGK